VFFPPRWEEEEARVLALAVKNFTSRSRWVTSVVQVLLRTSGVPYVRVSTAQLGVACLLGLGLLTVQGTCGRKRLYTHADWVEYLVWKSYFYFRWRCRRYHRQR
jgi:hypothetical protein